jgi:putative DNA primase/helicase
VSRHKTTSGREQRIAEDILRERNGHKENGHVGHVGYEPTDVGNAYRFLNQHGRRVRWCPSMRSFLLWDGKRWAKDECEQVRKMAQETARSIHHEAADAADQEEQRRISRWAVTSQNSARVTAMLGEAKPHIAVRMDALDTDPWLLNCQNVTIDLRTGERWDHDPNDLITQLVPMEYDPTAKAPRFEQFLQEVLVDEDVIQFVQRFAGYSLTGDTRERVLAILYGSGKNGKSTLVELLRDAMGDYADNTDVETILLKKYSGVGNDVAALKGARLVSTAEVEKGRRLAESKVKNLTGQDTVTARFLFCEPFSFRPEFKLWLSTNHKPEIQGTDDAIWDRIRLVPFTQRFDGKNQNTKLPQELREELPGVLAWMVAGCLEWQENGLGEPKKVREATKAYRTEMDVLAAFIKDCCVVDEDARTPATPLYQAYQRWCTENGETEETQRRFGGRLSERGFESFDITNGAYKGRKGWRGIGLRADGSDDDPSDPVDDPPPDGSNESGEDGSEEASKGLLGRRSVDDRLPGQLPIDKANTPSKGRESRPSRPKNQTLQATQPHEDNPLEKRSTSSTSSTSSTQTQKRRLTADEAHEVQRLIADGMEPGFARAEVLGEEDGLA